MKKRPQLLLWAAVFSLMLFGLFEVGKNGHVKGYFNVFWWWVVTSTTHGYGDIVPVTWQGQAVSIL